MTKNFNIKVTLDERDIALIKAMQKENFYGEGSFHDYLKSIFYLQLREDMETYAEELIGEVESEA